MSIEASKVERKYIIYSYWFPRPEFGGITGRDDVSCFFFSWDTHSLADSFVFPYPFIQHFVHKVLLSRGVKNFPCSTGVVRDDM